MNVNFHHYFVCQILLCNFDLFACMATISCEGPQS
jgi:hypothetical protein